VRKTYTVHIAPGFPAGGIRISADVPAGWTERLDAGGAPRYDVAGLTLGGPSIVVFPCNGDRAGCINLWIENHAGGEPVTRTPRDGGRVWVTRALGGGGIDARMYVPAFDQDALVVCVAELGARNKARLGELQQFCESVRVE